MIRSRVLSGLGVGVVSLVFAACGGSSDSGTPTSTPDNTPADVTIQVQSDPTDAGKFVPNPATAKVGNVVKWSFEDDQSPHTVTSDDTTSFDSGSKAKGEVFTHKFDKAGTFAFHCTLHANMKGSIAVS